MYYLFCRGIDHHWTKNLFATCSSKVQVWDHQRSEPTHEFSWGADSITSVKFNPAEASLLASTGSDRTVTLYDIRVASSMRKIVMEMRSNALAWNPMEPFNFTVVRIFPTSAVGYWLLMLYVTHVILSSISLCIGERGPQPVHVRHAPDEARAHGAQGPRVGSVRWCTF